jgi:hypothetical protein
VVAVNGDCLFGNATGYGLLRVRGELTLTGTFSWNGLVGALGQGVVHGTESTGSISGGLILARTRADDRTASNLLGTLLERRGAVTPELPPGQVTVSRDAEETRRANERFPYVVTAYREF